MSIKRTVADFVVGMLRLAIKVIGPTSAAYLAERLTLTTRAESPMDEIVLLASNSALLFRARTLLSKESETIAWIDSFESGCCLWDIGANVGVYSLYAAHRRAAQVLAFEPAAANYQVLNSNIELNAAGVLVRAYCLAFAQTSELGTLNMTNTVAGGATNNFNRGGELSPYAAQTGMVFKQGMLGFCIDEFMDRFKPRFPDHIKIDVDGIEELILAGATATLADRRLRSVLIELETTDSVPYQRCRSMLEDAGLVLSVTGGAQALGTSMRPMNHIFVRSV